MAHKENLVSFSRASINCHWLAPNPVSLRSPINRSLKRRERSKAKYSKLRYYVTIQRYFTEKRCIKQLLICVFLCLFGFCYAQRENLERMKRQPPPAYGDGSMNPYGGGSGQRMRGNTGTMSNSYGGGGGGRQEGYSNVEAEQHPGYKSSKAEGQWQWERESRNVHNQLPPHGFSEGE